MNLSLEYKSAVQFLKELELKSRDCLSWNYRLGTCCRTPLETVKKGERLGCQEQRSDLQWTERRNNVRFSQESCIPLPKVLSAVLGFVSGILQSGNLGPKKPIVNIPSLNQMAASQMNKKIFPRGWHYLKPWFYPTRNERWCKQHSSVRMCYIKALHTIAHAQERLHKPGLQIGLSP